MRAVLALVVLVAMSAHPVRADYISIFADAAGNGCVLQTPPVGPPGFSLYVVHKLNAGSGAAQFKVSDTTPFFATTQSTIAGLSLGAWNTDWSIAYGASCLVGQLVIATLNFVHLGTPLTCAHTMTIGPAPTSAIPGEIIIVDCAGGFETAQGGNILFGPGATHNCYCNPVGVHESTWGSVKALYR